ncbi:hypothetical protein, unlikely [Trypanosoma brucei gambiense DAL972]|uniref:Uncharacterized protein n=1 Tax=Trypanosoma brucei gambiense (strain MHOM/CI/86/DAL972) TaxID=679716 RepID=D0A2U1_TRYB9|nr:hypothetical protein, unlikely [Trypanosoma brucei gambiense DAL972]CBH15585.1 hypothetical protein, unlikely [Trypanosoma brucei gambiense DAL972]|eukprot:XP_011777849.1 hypothetical protein, unlikely [Trypanosoma brucei gambiense DAL972]
MHVCQIFLSVILPLCLFSDHPAQSFFPFVLYVVIFVIKPVIILVASPHFTPLLEAHTTARHFHNYNRRHKDRKAKKKLIETTVEKKGKKLRNINKLHVKVNFSPPQTQHPFLLVLHNNPFFYHSFLQKKKQILFRKGGKKKKREREQREIIKYVFS